MKSTAVEAANWLVLAEVAEVYASSEDPAHPLEHALVEHDGSGWRASDTGAQTIRIRFDHPQDIRLIHVVFEDASCERVHEFALQWSADDGRIFQPIVRQQFSFSPAGATRQCENYAVRLDGVTALELHMIPDISHRPQVATLRALRIR